jgi:hypothetical protein
VDQSGGMRLLGKLLLLICSHTITTTFPGHRRGSLIVTYYTVIQDTIWNFKLRRESSTAKIDPFASGQKEGVPHDISSRGVTGIDRSIDQARTDPVWRKGQYSHDSMIFSLSPSSAKMGLMGQPELCHVNHKLTTRSRPSRFGESSSFRPQP